MLYIFLRMEFEDFCHYFTDMVVCRLPEKSLFWPKTHWREVRCLGAWTFIPGVPPTLSSADLPIKTQVPSTGLQWSKQMPTQRRDQNEQKLSKKLKEGQTHREKMIKREKQEVKGRSLREGHRPLKEKCVEKQKGVEERRWEREMDKRNRCGGCINHRDTFLYNPQVNHSKSGKQTSAWYSVMLMLNSMKKSICKGPKKVKCQTFLTHLILTNIRLIISFSFLLFRLFSGLYFII